MIACTIPFSSASCESSISALNIIKARIQTTMGDALLDKLLCLCMENYFLKSKVSSDEEMNCMQQRRVDL